MCTVSESVSRLMAPSFTLCGDCRHEANQVYSRPGRRSKASSPTIRAWCPNNKDGEQSLGGKYAAIGVGGGQAGYISITACIKVSTSQGYRWRHVTHRRDSRCTIEMAHERAGRGGRDSDKRRAWRSQSDDKRIPAFGCAGHGVILVQRLSRSARAAGRRRTHEGLFQR